MRTAVCCFAAGAPRTLPLMNHTSILSPIDVCCRPAGCQASSRKLLQPENRQQQQANPLPTFDTSQLANSLGINNNAGGGLTVFRTAPVAGGSAAPSANAPAATPPPGSNAAANNASSTNATGVPGAASAASDNTTTAPAAGETTGGLGWCVLSVGLRGGMHCVQLRVQQVHCPIALERDLIALNVQCTCMRCVCRASFTLSPTNMWCCTSQQHGRHSYPSRCYHRRRWSHTHSRPPWHTANNNSCQCGSQHYRTTNRAPRHLWRTAGSSHCSASGQQCRGPHWISTHECSDSSKRTHECSRHHPNWISSTRERSDSSCRTQCSH